jgi:hypothetical protein
MNHRRLSIAFASLAAACTPSPVNVCEENLKATCAMEFRCCKDVERGSLLTSFTVYSTSESECFDSLKSVCTNSGGASEAVGLGRLAFNSEAYSTCTTARQAAIDGCDLQAFSTAQESCDFGDIFDGKVADGSACADDGECVGGLCEISYNEDGLPETVSVETGNVEGVCLSEPAAGQDCSDGNCAEGLFCNPDDVCAVLPGNGDECTFACAAGLYCGPGFLCAEQLDGGEACTFFSDCKSDDCLEDGTCAPVEAPAATTRCSGR